MIKIEGLDESTALTILSSKISSSLKKYLNQILPVKYDLIDFYHQNGIVKIENVDEPGFLSELKIIVEAAVLIRKGRDKRDLKEKSQYEKSFLQCGYLCWDFPAIIGIVSTKRLVAIVRDSMQARHVRLWHDQALFKEPGGRVTDAHKDISYWPIREPKFTSTIWLTLVDIPIEMGCIYFYPKTNDPNLKEYVDIFKNPHQPNFLRDKEKVFSHSKLVMQHFMPD